MYPPGAITKAYSDALFDIVNRSEELPDVIQKSPEWAGRFIIENLAVAKEIDDISREIDLILERLGRRPTHPIFRRYAIEELVLGAKHYFIAWSTMKDLMATLISSTFDLGIQDKDVNFGMVLRNKKVMKTAIPEICSAHASTIDVSGSDKRRNEAVHRGKLIDQEINAFQHEYSSLYGRRYSLMTLQPLTDEEFNAELQQLNAKLPALVSAKQNEFRVHFNDTMKLNQELASELGRIAGSILNNVKT